jgi:hypothetical protein
MKQNNQDEIDITFKIGLILILIMLFNIQTAEKMTAEIIPIIKSNLAVPSRRRGVYLH